MSRSLRIDKDDPLLKSADLLRFWLGWLVGKADVLGDSMDAPVRFPTIEAVSLESVRSYLHRYDAARATALGQEQKP